MILFRPKDERKKRSKAIRLDFNRRYPNQDSLRQELFDRQSGLCGIGKEPLQSADSVVAQIDHAISVYLYATWDYPIEEAVKHANAKKNLVLVCPTHHRSKGIRDLEEFLEQVEQGEINLGAPRLLTPGKIAKLKSLLAENGRKAGRIAVETGQLASLRTKKHQSEAGRIQGRKNAESGRIQALGRKNAENGRIQGRKNAQSGHLNIARCKRWNVDRGKSCVCGKHSEEKRNG